MLRIYMPIAFLVFFIGWVLYRLVIKKDLKKTFKRVLAYTFLKNASKVNYGSICAGLIAQ